MSTLFFDTQTLVIMPINKNALIRYMAIDNALSNHYRRWTLEDLVDVCSNALYDCEGITKGVSVRTVQSDIQIMRSDKLGYNAPIEVYDHKYYRYADRDYSIRNLPLSENEMRAMEAAVELLQQLQEFDHFVEIADVLGKLRDKIAVSKGSNRRVIYFDHVPDLKGLKHLSPLYNYITKRKTIKITYKSFSARKSQEHIIYPHVLKEFRNRWFLYGSDANFALHIYALDRIEGIEVVDTPYQDNPHFDAVHFFDDIIGVSKSLSSTPEDVTFWASSEQSRYIETKPLHPSQKLVSRCDDGGCIFTIRVAINYEMYSVFMSYGAGVKVMEPSHARYFMKRQLQSAASLYK